MNRSIEPIFRFWWLYVPAGFFVLQALVEIVLPRSILAPLHTENGPHEVLQAVVIFIALIIALRCVMAAQKAGYRWIMAWAGLAALCCLYVGGEEISWGQHVFDWTTPEFWSRVNDQNETNFHNTSSWLDQKPKLILQIGVYVGGLIVPLLLRKKPGLLPARFTMIYPSHELGVTAAIALFIMIQHKTAQKVAALIFFTRANEVQELYLYYFVALYMTLLLRRLLQR